MPRVGFRATYYGKRGTSVIPFSSRIRNALIPDFLMPDPTRNMPLVPGGDLRTRRERRSRGLFQGFAGVGGSAESHPRSGWPAPYRAAVLELFLRSTAAIKSAEAILQFDRFIPSTRLRPIDFPQFTSIDSLDNWSIARVGIRNRLQTRRDDLTFNWMELETYFDANFDNPYNKSDYSNVYNNLRFNPLPWAASDRQLAGPAFVDGFTEINTSVRFQPMASLQLALAHRFLNEIPFFENSSLFAVGRHLPHQRPLGRADSRGTCEASTGFIEEQRYTIYRDLTSWVASLGAVVRNNGGVKEYGVLLLSPSKPCRNSALI